MTKPATFKIAQVSSAHGIRGEVKLYCYLEDPSDLARYAPLTDNKGRSYTPKLVGQQKELLIVKFDHITDRNAAELLRGVELYADAGKLPTKEDDDAFYVNDLVGLEARLESGSVYGRVQAVVDYGAGDILEITRTDGSEEMIPFTESFVGDVMVDEGYLVIFPPDYIEAD